ncbi:MAG TPA: sulfite exporter TauE/SafE family protein, partial [Flavobacterium sp.]
MTEYIGYACALIIGLILGISGAGGSILTVPVLVYIMHLSPVTATAYSLFIVGTTSAFGTIQNLSTKLVEIKTAFLFALPSLMGVYISRKFLVPAIPDIIFHSEGYTLRKGTLLMLLFGVVIFIASIKMLKNEHPQKSTIKHGNKIL